MSSIEPSAIHQRAYACWQDRGCPVGSPDQDWFEAEQALLHEQQKLEAASLKPAPVLVAAPVVSPPAKKSAPPRPRARRGTISSTLAAAASIDGTEKAPESKTEAVAATGNRKSRRAARSA
jgi:hypothetical protein